MLNDISTETVIVKMGTKHGWIGKGTADEGVGGGISNGTKG